MSKMCFDDTYVMYFFNLSKIDNWGVGLGGLS